MRKYFLTETTEVFPGLIPRSKAAIDYERFAHFTFHPYIIHPYSRFRIYWEITMLFYSVMQFVAFFPMWFFLEHNTVPYVFVLSFTLLVNSTDLVLTFFTGYVEKETELIVLEPKKIATRYMCTTLLLDFLAAIPLELVTALVCRECLQTSGQYVSLPRHLICFSTVAGFFLRIGTVFGYLVKVCKVLFWNPFFFGLIANIYLFLCISVLHILTLVLMNYLMDKKEVLENQLWSHFTQTLGFLLQFPFSIAFEHPTVIGWIYMIRIPCLLLIVFFTLYLWANVIKFCKSKMKTKERFYTLESNVACFARKRQLPFSLQRRALLYVKVLVHSNHYKENEIANYFPEASKSDIFSSLCIPMLRGFSAFEDFPLYVLRRLSECLKYQLYLPNEIVFMKHDTKVSLYFIQSGTVALYSGTNIELYHFEDGSNFNGKYFVEEKIPTNKYAISLEVTEVYRLDYDDFREIMDPYPDLLKRMKERFYQRMSEDSAMTVVFH